MLDKYYSAQQIFEEQGFIQLPIGNIKANLFRLYQTVTMLQQNFLMSQGSRLKSSFRWRPLFGSNSANWGVLSPPQLRSLENEARKVAAQLPKNSCEILTEELKVTLFGETKVFDHLDFSSWFNGFFSSGTQFKSALYEMFAPHKPSTRQKLALEQWVADLTVMAELLVRLREQCVAMTGFPAIRAEHVHLKSWQVRGYKAQWWHLDRGEISAIATIAGHPTTEFLLAEDPAPYPERPVGYDVFVFPRKLNQLVHHCPVDDMLICGARARKERGHSYLWHRAPESDVERIVFILKTHRTTT